MVVAVSASVLVLRSAQSAPPAERFAHRIATYKESEAIARDTLGRLMVELEQFPAFVKIDGPVITRHLQEVARTWAEAAAALEKGNETAAAALAQRAEETAGERERWQERLRWRGMQSLPAMQKLNRTNSLQRKNSWRNGGASARKLIGKAGANSTFWNSSIGKAPIC